MLDQPQIHIFGEVLFDHFPDGSRILGGAPFNVAWHLQALGLAPRFISSIGDDQPGQEITARMAEWGLSHAAVQLDVEHPTGSVQVRFEAGEPHYEIVADSAYDFFDSRLLETQTSQGILYHGSLALRNPASRAALQTLKTHHQGPVFVDVNLRAPWWQQDTLLPLLYTADWVKLNQVELMLLSVGDDTLESTMLRFHQQFDLHTLIVTRGEKGAIACDSSQQFISVEPSASTEVVDTVGAGDAFSAILLLGLSRQWPLAITLQRAQTFASALVGKRGATVADRDFYQPFKQAWR